LRRAANSGGLEEIKVLFSNCGAANIINEKDDNPEKGLTALHYALLRNKVAIVAYLLREGAQTDIPGTKIGTAAELIAASENPEIRSLNKGTSAHAIGTGNSTWHLSLN
jgi:ankyrin repeat protein